MKRTPIADQRPLGSGPTCAGAMPVLRENSKVSSSISRFLVLAFARLTNYAILLVSPIVFVRILDQHAYGQYR
jgi:hypothetical protein